jgi:hypothetical protein
MTSDGEPITCNLDVRGARRRSRVGVVLAVVTVVTATVVVVRGASPWWGLAAALPAYGAVLGFLQAKSFT